VNDPYDTTCKLLDPVSYGKVFFSFTKMFVCYYRYICILHLYFTW